MYNVQHNNIVPLSPRVARPGESDPWPGLGLEAKVIETIMSSIRNDRKYIKTRAGSLAVRTESWTIF